MGKGKLQNLKLWPNSISGIPTGEPRDRELTAAYRELLGKPFPGDKAGRTYAQIIAEVMVREACLGNVQAAKEIALRTEGPPRFVPPKPDEDV